MTRPSTRPELPEPDGAETGIDAQRLCDAASAVFFAIVRYQSMRTGRSVPVPLLLCPMSTPPCPCDFSRDELAQAEAFLLRLGFIGRRHDSDMPMVDL